MNERITQIMLGVLILLALIAVAMLQTGQRDTLRVQRAILERLETLESAPVTTTEYAVADPTVAPAPDPATTGTDPDAGTGPAIIEDPAPPRPGDTRPPLDIVGISTPTPPQPSDSDAGPRDPDPTPPTPTDAGDDQKWQRFGPTIEQVMRDLLDGKYGDVAKRFNTDMASALDATRLAAAMNPVRQRAGRFKRVDHHESLDIPMPSADMHPFRVIVATEKDERLTFTITVTDAKQIAGLYIN